MLPPLHMLSLNEAVSVDEISRIEEYAILHGISWIDSFFRLSGPSKKPDLLSVLDQVDLAPIGALKRPNSQSNLDNPTMTVSMFGNGPLTPSTIAQVQYMMESAGGIYAAKIELNDFMVQKHHMPDRRSDLRKEFRAFYDALTLHRQALNYDIAIEKWELFTIWNAKNTTSYLQYLHRLSKELDRTLQRRGVQMNTPWKDTLFATRTIKLPRRQGGPQKDMKVPELHVLEAVRTLFYYVEIASDTDKLVLMPSTEYPISLFGMNAKTWHELRKGSSPWSWLVLIPSTPRSDLGYQDDLTDLKRIIVHLQREKRGSFTWRPDTIALERNPWVLVFQGNECLGYYFYVGFEEEDEATVRPPRAILMRTSALTNQMVAIKGEW